MVQRLAADLHQILPDTHIWLGGPEVSFEPEVWFQRMPFLTGIMVGEGEETFLQLMKYYEGREETALHDIPGIVWSAPLQEAEEKTSGQRLEEPEYRFLPEQTLQVYGNPLRQPMDLSQVPFVYDHMEGDTSHKIIYYESSRGCPFSCSYCLSSIDKKLRFRDWSLVERELAYFLEKKV